VALLHQKAQPVVNSLINKGLVEEDFRGRPYNPSQTSSSKFLVLMTDGQNTRFFHLNDGFRSGSSPFWLSTYAGRDIVSVRRASHNDFAWYYPPTKQIIFRSRPYGLNGAKDCFPTRRGNICSPQVSAANSYTKRLSYPAFWEKRYTLKFVRQFSWLGDPGRMVSNKVDSDGNGIMDMDQRLLDQCSAAKETGITIYTIEMETATSSYQVLNDCASMRNGKRLHFKVSGLSISSVFSKIAADINKLRLIE
jgi:hypothetical protein